jgi:Anticodon binding domain
MSAERPARAAPPNLFTGADVAEILRERGWASAEMSSPQLDAWCERAAAMLGSHAADRAALADLLALIFHYDAAAVLQPVESHAVLARYGARDVVRRLAFLLLEGLALDSERFKEIINVIKESSDLRSRDLFLPIRLALAGKAGDGELDRIVLLLDEAAALAFAVPVKSARARILEFCAALD